MRLRVFIVADNARRLEHEYAKGGGREEKFDADDSGRAAYIQVGSGGQCVGKQTTNN